MGIGVEESLDRGKLGLVLGGIVGSVVGYLKLLFLVIFSGGIFGIVCKIVVGWIM